MYVGRLLPGHVSEPLLHDWTELHWVYSTQRVFHGAGVCGNFAVAVLAVRFFFFVAAASIRGTESPPAAWFGGLRRMGSLKRGLDWTACITDADKFGVARLVTKTVAVHVAHVCKLLDLMGVYRSSGPQPVLRLTAIGVFSDIAATPAVTAVPPTPFVRPRPSFGLVLSHPTLLFAMHNIVYEDLSDASLQQWRALPRQATADDVTGFMNIDRHVGSWFDATDAQRFAIVFRGSHPALRRPEVGNCAEFALVVTRLPVAVAADDPQPVEAVVTSLWSVNRSTGTNDAGPAVSIVRTWNGEPVGPDDGAFVAHVGSIDQLREFVWLLVA